MAGDWIKMRIDLQSHPKVVRILSATKSDKFRVIGGLHAVWAVFDTHSEDGVLKGYTPEALDHVIGWEGFSAAMIAVKWLCFNGADELQMPEFSEHNGKSGKRRAEDQKRKRDARNCPQYVRNMSADEQDENRTREEKRREEDKDHIVGSTPTDGVVVPIRPDIPDCPHQEIIALYHEILPTLTQVRKWDGARAKSLTARWRENPKHQRLDYWRGFFGYVAKSDFLMGRSTRWRADLEWLTKSGNFTKVIEGKYENEEAQQ